MTAAPRALPGCSLLLMALVLLAGCTSAGTHHSIAADPTAGRAAPAHVARPSPAATSPGGGGTSRLGLAPAPAGLSDRIELTRVHPRTVRSIHGTLVVTNTGGRPVNLDSGDCRTKFDVQLTDNHVAPSQTFTQECRRRPYVVQPGTTRIPITVPTSYQGCYGPPLPTRSAVPCLKSGGIPTLPAGTYRAVLVGDGETRLPPADPVPVILVG